MPERCSSVAAKGTVIPAAKSRRTNVFPRVAALLFLTLAYLLPASADIVGYTSINLSGTGHGTVNEILTFGNVGSGLDMSASGCVGWGLTGDSYGGCPIDAIGSSSVFASMQDIAKSHTITASQISLTSPFSLAIVFDASEPGGNKADVWVQQLTLTFYNPTTGAPIFLAPLQTPSYIPGGTSGSGGSGQTYGLDWDQAVLAQQAINAALGVGNFSTVRIGLGAELTQFDGHGYFWIIDVPNLVEAPEPATLAMIGGGLLLLGFLGRRFRRA